MYRLLRRYTLPVQNLQLATIHINLQKTSQICSFCSVYHTKRIKPRSCLLVYPKDFLPDCSHGAFRHQSTNTSTAFLNERVPKKIKHKMRNYAELLEVSEETTTNTKAKIKKLNAASVSSFANQPEISLDQLHKIRKPKKLPNHEKSAIDNKQETEFNNSLPFDIQEDMNIITIEKTEKTNIPEDETSIQEDLMVLGSSDQTTLIKNASVLNSLQYHEETMNENNLDSLATTTTATIKKAEKRTKSKLKASRRESAAKVKIEELERRGREEILKRNLHSYLDVCLNSGMIHQAYATLLYYRNRAKRIEDLPNITDVNLHNTILHGFARHGNLKAVQHVLEIINEDSIKPNNQTYAAIFECVGRLGNNHNHKRFLETILSEMTTQGIELNDLLNKSIFVRDQREMIIQGIRIVVPDFEAIYQPPNISYTNHLLNKISRTDGAPNTPAKGILTTSELNELGKQQMELEIVGHITVKSIAAAAEPTPLVLHCRNKVIQIEEDWKTVISEAFRRDLTALKNRHHSGSHLQRSINLYPYLKILDESHYVNVVLNEIRLLATGSETFSPSLTALTRHLGQNIYQKYQIEMKTRNGIRDKISSVYEKYCDSYLNGHEGMNTRAIWQSLVHEEKESGPTIDGEIIQWPASVLAGIGRFLYNIILRDIRVDANALKANSKTERYLPGFYAVFRNNRQMITQEIKPHPILSRIFKEAKLETLTFEPAQLPSLSPPVPWYTIRNGGYLVSEAKIIRLSYQAVQQWKRLENVPQQQLYPVLDSLNQLGSIPWKVNNPVLDIALNVFQNGGDKNLDIPEPPNLVTAPIFIDPDASREEKNQAAKARLKERKRKTDMYSLWCETLYRLSLANHYRGQVFWLPHSMDFRGRVYPIPPHVNHLGSDLARSLMVFALGKPLGPDGLDWLKIHIVNLTGLKKRKSNADRLNYANEILPKILDSAEKPLDGEKWWQTSEEPWQTLAACFEIAQALKSPNPAEYVSQFPIHQDGSCNGLQHYAALGRDKQGAESVNLSPSPKPQDVYSSIAALVEKERQQDADQGLQIAQKLEGLIKRKVIKQTVMTTVYGVTRFGARLQIARQLKEIEFPDEHLWQGSHYLVNKTFHSLREMFTSTKLIQDWLTDCARLVALVCGQNMEWITPLGLPVVQPYNKTVQAVNGAKVDQHFRMDMFDRPNVMKQKNAFPPNFIHSLDSSHMMLTSLHCDHAGLTFVSVHDCFWTHACTVPAMNKICREQFVALHSEPILENLSKFLTEKFSYKDSELLDDGTVTELSKLKLNNILSEVPKQGEFDLNSVLKSVYFFS